MFSATIRRPGKYREVTLNRDLLRPLNAVLEPTKAEVVATGGIEED
jgi:hypothetical protein